MKGHSRILGPAVGLILVAGSLTAGGLFEPREYAARRGRLMEKIPDGVAIVFLRKERP